MTLGHYLGIILDICYIICDICDIICDIITWLWAFGTLFGTLFVTLWLYLWYCDILVFVNGPPVSYTMHSFQFDNWRKCSKHIRNVDNQTSTENIDLNLLFATGNSHLWHCGPIHAEGQGTVQREEVPAGGGRRCLQGNFIIIIAPWLVLNSTR